MTRRAIPAVSDENAELIGAAYDVVAFPFRYTNDFIVALVANIADALDQAESQLATVRRSADAWWKAYDEAVKRTETVRADQIRRDAELLDELAASLMKRMHGNTSSASQIHHAEVAIVAYAADRLRAQGGGEG